MNNQGDAIRSLNAVNKNGLHLSMRNVVEMKSKWFCASKHLNMESPKSMNLKSQHKVFSALRFGALGKVSPKDPGILGKVNLKPYNL